MKIDRNKKIREIVIDTVLASSILGGVFFGFQTVKGILELHNQNAASNSQVQIVEDAINEGYVECTPEVHTEDSHESHIDDQEEHTQKYNFEQLWETNPNIVGIIEGDCFDGGYYPVVSTDSFEEENYYLNRSIDGEYSGTGTIFSDYRSDNTMQSDVTAIWGHNMHGRDGIMFTSLTNYKDNEYYNKHKNLKYYTPNGEYILEVFAYIEDDPREQRIGNYNSPEEMKKDITSIIEESLIKTQIDEINTEDRIMVLYTCTDLGSLNDPYNRAAVYTRLNPVWEKTNNHKLK